jgi:hypothetical protein
MEAPIRRRSQPVTGESRRAIIDRAYALLVAGADDAEPGPLGRLFQWACLNVLRQGDGRRLTQAAVCLELASLDPQSVREVNLSGTGSADRTRFADVCCTPTLTETLDERVGGSEASSFQSEWISRVLNPLLVRACLDLQLDWVACAGKPASAKRAGPAAAGSVEWELIWYRRNPADRRPAGRRPSPGPRALDEIEGRPAPPPATAEEGAVRLNARPEPPTPDGHSALAVETGGPSGPDRSESLPAKSSDLPVTPACNSCEPDEASQDPRFSSSPARSHRSETPVTTGPATPQTDSKADRSEADEHAEAGARFDAKPAAMPPPEPVPPLLSPSVAAAAGAGEPEPLPPADRTAHATSDSDSDPPAAVRVPDVGEAPTVRTPAGDAFTQEAAGSVVTADVGSPSPAKRERRGERKRVWLVAAGMAVVAPCVLAAVVLLLRPAGGDARRAERPATGPIGSPGSHPASRPATAPAPGTRPARPLIGPPVVDGNRLFEDADRELAANRFTQAVAQFTEAIRWARGEKLALSYLGRGHARCMLGDYDGAVEDLREAAARLSGSSPGESTKRIVAVCYQRRAEAFRDGVTDPAVRARLAAALEKGLGKNPTHPKLNCLEAEYWMYDRADPDRKAKAARNLGFAVRRDDYAHAHFLQAVWCFKAGSYAEAVRWCDSAAAADGQFPATFHLRAAAHARLGHAAPAAADRAKAEELDRAHPGRTLSGPAIPWLDPWP